MNKPQGYLHSAREASEVMFSLLLLCLPFYRGVPYFYSLFTANLSRVVLSCILAFLLLFLAKHSKDIAQAVRGCIYVLCAGLVLPKNCPSNICFALPVRAVQDPLLTPFLKRPPPSLLASCL